MPTTIEHTLAKAIVAPMIDAFLLATGNMESGNVGVFSRTSGFRAMYNTLTYRDVCPVVGARASALFDPRANHMVAQRYRVNIETIYSHLPDVASEHEVRASDRAARLYVIRSAVMSGANRIGFGEERMIPYETHVQSSGGRPGACDSAVAHQLQRAFAVLVDVITRTDRDTGATTVADAVDCAKLRVAAESALNEAVSTAMMRFDMYVFVDESSEVYMFHPILPPGYCVFQRRGVAAYSSWRQDSGAGYLSIQLRCRRVVVVVILFVCV